MHFKNSLICPLKHAKKSMLKLVATMHIQEINFATFYSGNLLHLENTWRIYRRLHPKISISLIRYYWQQRMRNSSLSLFLYSTRLKFRTADNKTDLFFHYVREVCISIGLQRKSNEIYNSHCNRLENHRKLLTKFLIARYWF